jgi:ubiquinone/menaquinone biosynthesis C-methylase UbiE
MTDLQAYAKQTLKTIGIYKGQTILDCCCGDGTYTIPAAKLVGEEGLVYAIDRSDSKLDDLKDKIKLEKLQNIKIIEEDVESGISLPQRVEVVLLYDIFWYFGPRDKKTERLLKEVYKVAKDNAMISVFPTHTSSNGIKIFKEKMKATGFSLESEHTRKVVHEKHVEEGRILNFKKLSNTNYK